MTIDPIEFIDELIKHQINFVSGVPDNINSSFSICLDLRDIEHVNVPHESHAVAVAAGYNIKTNKLPLVYLQNSGLGNVVNPVTSICDSAVYHTPCLFLIGHRQDEDQHKKMGSITKSLLGQLDIKHSKINKNFKSQIAKAVNYCRSTNKSYAFIADKNTFDKISRERSQKGEDRSSMIDSICRMAGKNDAIVTCTGFTSREMFEVQKKRKNKYIMNVGGMGLTSALAVGMARHHKGKVFCLDGDAAILMHMGFLCIGSKQANLIHILFNNGMHESVGGNDTAQPKFNFKDLAKISGYNKVMSCNKYSLKNTIAKAKKNNGSCFIEIITNGKSRKNLSRPDIKLQSLKKNI
jgi:phosphonopyruvate decarboxylase